MFLKRCLCFGEWQIDECRVDEGLRRAACGGEGPEVMLEGDKEDGLPLRRGELELMRFSVAPPSGETGGLNESDLE